MGKILVLFGFVLMTFCSCSTIQEVKYLPVYRKPVNLCISDVKKPSCDILKGETDLSKFRILADCLVEYVAYINMLNNYISCLENAFGDNDE